MIPRSGFFLFSQENWVSRENWLVSGFVEVRFLYEFVAIPVVDIWVMKGVNELMEVLGLCVFFSGENGVSGKI